MSLNANSAKSRANLRAQLTALGAGLGGVTIDHPTTARITCAISPIVWTSGSDSSLSGANGSQREPLCVPAGRVVVA